MILIFIKGYMFIYGEYLEWHGLQQNPFYKQCYQSDVVDN